MTREWPLEIKCTVHVNGCYYYNYRGSMNRMTNMTALQGNWEFVKVIYLQFFGRNISDETHCEMLFIM